MNNFIFQNSTRVYFGKGCVKEYLACLTKGANTILLAYGGGSIKRSGVYDEITEILHDAGKTVVEFPGIMSNPTYAKVQAGAKLARARGVEMILAVGGGSVMDCSKAISLAARYDGDIWDNFWARPGVIAVEPLPLGVIVTVAGTGSECNGGAVITNEEKRVKTGRDYPQLNPRFALMDPTYTYTVPQSQMVSGGFDILSHIMENYFSEPNRDNVSDDIMEALMKSVIRNLRVAMENPRDYTARSRTGSLKWASAVIFSATIWSTSWVPIPIATTAVDWRCCTRYITGTFIGMACPNLCGLRKMSGALPGRENPMKHLPWQGSTPWRRSSGSWACPPPCVPWASGRSSLTRLPDLAPSPQAVTGR